MAKVYFRKWIPEEILEEQDNLMNLFSHRILGTSGGFFDNNEEVESAIENAIEKGIVSDENFLDDMEDWIYNEGSDLLKAWMDYSKHFGDEGELLDDEGNIIYDKNGYAIQCYIRDEDGYAAFPCGKRIFDKNDMPIKVYEMPECIRKLRD